MKLFSYILIVLMLLLSSLACKPRRSESNIKQEADATSLPIVIYSKGTFGLAIESCDSARIQMTLKEDSFNLNSTRVIDERKEPYPVLQKVTRCFIQKKIAQKDFEIILDLLISKHVMRSEAQNAGFSNRRPFLFDICDSSLMNKAFVSKILSAIEGDEDRRRYLSFGAHDGKIIDYVFFRYNLDVLKILQKHGAPTSQCLKGDSDKILGLERSQRIMAETKKTHLEHIHFNILRLKNIGSQEQDKQSGNPEAIQAEIDTINPPVSEELQSYIDFFRIISNREIEQQLVDVFATVSCFDPAVLKTKDAVQDFFNDPELN